MFLKQYNYKPRSNSQSSGNTDSNSTQTAASPTDLTSAANQQGRRRSSVTEKFAGLHSVKRNSNDAAGDAKKASFADQKPGNPGILGGMWQSFTKGGS